MIEEILKSKLVGDIIKDRFNNKKLEVIKRQASYIIKLKDEPKDKVTRLILLSPSGFTSNRIDELSSHPEVRKAKVKIIGGVKPSRKGFNIIKKVIKFIYYTKREIKTIEDYPYVLADKNNSFYKEEIKSSREKFFVVKENGEGFYHNLINLSKEWVLLVLEKELRFQKEMNIIPKIENLNEKSKEIIRDLIQSVQEKGDNIFNENKELIKKLLELKANETLPALIEGLNMYETGKHEPCSIYALILKFAKKDKEIVIRYVKKALEKNEAQMYYLNELLEKIQ